MKRLAGSAQDADQIQRLDELLTAESRKANTHRMLLGVQSGNKEALDYRFCGGKDSSSISPSDPFFIASITKMMTATVIMQLVDEKRVELDQRISAYLPHELSENIHVYKGQDYSLEVRVHELLHHTSGISDYSLDKQAKSGNDEWGSLWDDIIEGGDVQWTPHDAVQKARNLTPKFQPSASSGRRSYYSDTNYQLLGAIIQKVTSKSVAENFQSRIFEPLKMSENTYLYDHFQESKRKTQPMNFYNKDKELKIPKAMTSFGADGGVVSTLDDLLIFLRAYFDGKLFSKSHHERMQSQWNMVSFPIQYGYGVMRFKMPRWMTLFLFDSPELLGHSGANSSFAFYSPEEEVFVAGTFNQVDQRSRPFQFMLQVIAILKS